MEARELGLEQGDTQRILLSEEDVNELADCQVDDQDSSVCAICLAEIHNGGPAVSLPCQHSFHRQCVTKWLSECAATCPVCKQSADCTAVPEEHVTIQLVRPCSTRRCFSLDTS